MMGPSVSFVFIKAAQVVCLQTCNVHRSVAVSDGQNGGIVHPSCLPCRYSTIGNFSGSFRKKDRSRIKILILSFTAYAAHICS